MSISQAKFMGGAKYTALSADAQLHASSARVQAFLCSTTLKVVSLPEDIRLDQAGGTWFWIINLPTSSEDFSVTQGDEVLEVLSPGEVAIVYSMDGPSVSFKTMKRTLNTARAASHSARGAVANPEEAETFDPSCFEGDPCEASTPASSGVAIPMFQNPCDARNQWREPVRAADFHMPLSIPVVFPEGFFSDDPNHPLAVDLSPQAYVALYNGGGPHFLTYDGPAHGTSRHWHHVRYAGNIGTLPGAWVLNPGDAELGIDVARHVWKKLVTYTVAGATKTIEIRIQAEWAASGGVWHPILVETPEGVDYTASTLSQAAADSSINDSAKLLATEGFAVGQVIAISGFTGGGYNGTARVTYVADDGSKLRFTGAYGATATAVNDAAGESVHLVADTGGGTSDEGVGAWGTLLDLRVFCDEHTALSTYEPVGSGAVPATFTRDDPCCWGGLDPWADPAQKFCHPQMLFCASVPTNFQAPCGSDWVPAEEAGRAYCYQVPNGAPWTTAPGCCGAVDAQNGVWPNVVFGDVVAGFAWGTVTTGGGFPESAPTPWMCFENGEGVGRTFLKPSAAGWDEAIGDLNVAGGTAAEVSFCDVGQRQFSPCTGHPDEPFGGVGGSHTCFKNAVDADDPDAPYCCTTLEEDRSEVLVDVVQACVSATTTYIGVDPGNPSVCLDPDSSGCVNVGTRSTSFILPLYDYTMAMDADPITRLATWKLLVNDPDYPGFPFAYDGTNSADLSADIGACTDDDDTIKTTSYGATELKFLATQRSTGPFAADFKDYEVEAVAVFREGDMTPHALVLRGDVNGSDEFTGYMLLLEPSDGGTAVVPSLLIWTADTALVLYAAGPVELTFASGEARVRMVFRAVGSHLTARWSPVAGSIPVEGSTELDDCDLEDGYPGIATTDSADAAWWEELAVTDLSEPKVEVEARMLSDQMDATVDQKATAGYGWCDEVVTVGPPGLGVPPDCSGTQTTYTRSETLNEVGAEPLSTLANSGESTIGGGGNLTCSGVPTLTGIDRCAQCPPPFKHLSAKFPAGCGSDSDRDMTICRGVEWWTAAVEIIE